jgi:hypothetical protein
MLMGMLVVAAICGATALFFWAGSAGGGPGESRAAQPSVFFWLCGAVIVLGLLCLGLGWWSP